MTKNHKDENQYLNDAEKVAQHQQRFIANISETQDDQSKALDSAIANTEEFLIKRGYQLPEESNLTSNSNPNLRAVILKESWNKILNEATKAVPETTDFNSLLTESEIQAVMQKHALIGQELDWFSTINRYDLALSVAAGIIAGVVDVLLVGVPAHPGFLGSPKSEGGWLSNVMKDKIGQLFPKEKISELEKAYPVPFDLSTNSSLRENIAGLGPRTHRFQSLGHDPLLGFIFGVRDLLTGEFTAIGKDGHLVIQKVADPFLQGEQIFIRILEAMKTQLGHLASDIATPAGLPAPLMSLLLFLQTGKIGKHAYTIGEVARQMYRSGYDFRHFMSGSVPVMITEIIIRLGYFIRSIHDGKSLAESIPIASSIKLRRQLLVAHSVATLINAGKVYVTQNPLAISWAQSLAFLRYVMPELTYLLHGKEAERSKMVQKEILNEYQEISAEFDKFLTAKDDFVLVA